MSSVPPASALPLQLPSSTVLPFDSSHFGLVSTFHFRGFAAIIMKRDFDSSTHFGSFTQAATIDLGKPMKQILASSTTLPSILKHLGLLSTSVCCNHRHQSFHFNPSNSVRPLRLLESLGHLVCWNNQGRTTSVLALALPLQLPEFDSSTTSIFLTSTSLQPSILAGLP
ncbi:Hypothetical predicted protein [Olea europaea subsp. europaea]|uniref:Uncharacterized protein n=1 Tax=Olea europaea subsp. europaea TaxID=158383 RepID=A0A8S0QN35_OLEEU|nr:Hypothetical predicted protein [Olea europaea subsp. europaea]